VTRPTDRNAATDGPAPTTELAGYEVVVGVCGGIAGYKVAALVSQLVQGGASVAVAMTRAARRFVTPLTFEALSGRPVFTSLWRAGEVCKQPHLKLTEACDVLIIAPATANTIAKLAHGLADDPVSTLALSATSPILLAPAMNTRMWQSRIVQQNMQSLKDRGMIEVPPGEGWLACRTIGPGRMAEPQIILSRAVEILKRSAPSNITQ